MEPIKIVIGKVKGKIYLERFLSMLVLMLLRPFTHNVFFEWVFEFSGLRGIFNLITLIAK